MRLADLHPPGLLAAGKLTGTPGCQELISLIGREGISRWNKIVMVKAKVNLARNRFRPHYGE